MLANFASSFFFKNLQILDVDAQNTFNIAESDPKCEFHFLTLSLVTGKARELVVVFIESPVLAALVAVSNSIY